jgi:hypothetical protein
VRDLVWVGVVVEERNIATQISVQRKLVRPHVAPTALRRS